LSLNHFFYSTVLLLCLISCTFSASPKTLQIRHAFEMHSAQRKLLKHFEICIKCRVVKPHSQAGAQEICDDRNWG